MDLICPKKSKVLIFQFKIIEMFKFNTYWGIFTICFVNCGGGVAGTKSLIDLMFIKT